MIESLRYLLAWVLYILMQDLLFNNMTLFHAATPFVFLLFLILLPLNLPVIALLGIGFVTGLAADLFYGVANLGLHTAACTLVMLFRNRLVSIISSSNVRNINEISFRQQNSVWITSLLLPMILIHHSAYFLLDAFSLHDFFFTLLKILSSSLYTFLLTFMLFTVFYKR
ncbi:MAG: hypothetical protein SF053_09655 [Bacteroidia bacterium]|nr:hypothetical protein [Bacteroidia bacterium]